jgi:quercetin dioxygenase-like cupin family protein
MVGLAAAGVAAAAGAQEVAAPVDTSKAGGDFAGGSKVFKTSTAVRTKLANGGERLGAFMGTLATGEVAGMHESWIPAGTPAPALHKITHSEMVAVLEGEVEFEHEGKKEMAVAGDVIYVAYGTTHAMRNAGAGVARYMVFQVGK